MYLKVKRLFDFILALIGLILLSPLFLIIIIAIKLDSRGPVFFKQKRVGVNKTHFNILKFRTMRIDTPKDMPTHLLKNPEQYITKVGKFLRKTSLDELPQILNIIAGSMAIVGPRPALWNQYDLIAERDKYGANNIRPGLTGWAQINGRDTVSIKDKARYDGDYVENLGVKIDAKCFFGTVISVLKRDGVLEGGVKEAVKADENSFFSDMGCKIIETPVDRRGVNPIRDFGLILNYIKIMKELKPDIIFSYTIKPNVYGCIASNFTKNKQVSNITGTGATFLKNNAVSTIAKILYKISIKKSYKVFFQNTGDKDYFVKNKMVRNNYAMLPGSGVNLEQYEVCNLPSENETNFIFIGRVMELKGMEQYLQCAKVIKEKYPNTNF